MATLTSLSDELKYRKGISAKGTIAGIPSKYFVLVFGAFIMGLIMIGPLSGLVISSFFFLSFYLIHRDDPAAIEVWMYALLHTVTSYHTHLPSEKSVYVQSQDGRVLSFQQLTKECSQQ